MRIIKSITITSFLFIALNLLFPEEWDKSFGGGDNDRGKYISMTRDGGWIAVGETESFGSGLSDIWLVKLNETGSREWTQVFGGTNQDKARCVRQTDDGGYVIMGNTFSYGAGNFDAWVIKVDAFGNEVWNQTYGGIAWDKGYSIRQTDDGGYIFTGTTKSFAAEKSDIWVVKTDSNGEKEWEKTFGGYEEDGAWSVDITTEGGYIIAGYTFSKGSGKKDAQVINLDSQGNLIWDKTYGGTSGDYAYDIKASDDGSFLFVGTTYSSGCGFGDFWAVKIDSEGETIWENTAGGSSYDRALSITETSDHCYWVCGYTESFDSIGKDGMVLKIDSDGNILRNESFGGDGDDTLFCVEESEDGDFVSAGETSSNSLLDFDFWILRSE